MTPVTLEDLAARIDKLTSAIRIHNDSQRRAPKWVTASLIAMTVAHIGTLAMLFELARRLP